MAMILVMITITRIVAILLLVLPMVLVLLLMNPEATCFRKLCALGVGSPESAPSTHAAQDGNIYVIAVI